MALKIQDLFGPINNVLHRNVIVNGIKELLGFDNNTRRGNVHLGALYDGITSIQFDLDPTIGTHQIGQMHWDADANTISVGMLGGDVELQIGQENHLYCFNNTAADIADGVPVYLVDAGDQKPRIAPAQATTAPKAYCLGMTTETVEKGTSGYVTTLGLVRGINTNHITEGYPAYLSTTVGEYSMTAPEVPNFTTRVGFCVRQHVNQGVMFVSPDVEPSQQVHKLPETTTPNAIASVGQVYCKSDNKIYFQDGAGVEHEIAFV